MYCINNLKRTAPQVPNINYLKVKSDLKSGTPPYFQFNKI